MVTIPDLYLELQPILSASELSVLLAIHKFIGGAPDRTGFILLRQIQDQTGVAASTVVKAIKGLIAVGVLYRDLSYPPQSNSGIRYSLAWDRRQLNATEVDQREQTAASWRMAWRIQRYNYRDGYPLVLEEIGNREGWRCQYCRRLVAPDGTLVPNLDHKVPRSAGGSDDPANLILSCSECNSLKAGMSYDEFVARIAEPVRDRRTVPHGVESAPKDGTVRDLRRLR
jgi:5-methylcytosine-specific restriction endonuclease McrA